MLVKKIDIILAMIFSFTPGFPVTRDLGNKPSLRNSGSAREQRNIWALLMFRDVGLPDSKFLKSDCSRMWPDIRRHIQPEAELETDSVMAAALLSMLMICMKLHNLPVNCSNSICVVVAHCNV